MPIGKSFIFNMSQSNNYGHDFYERLWKGLPISGILDGTWKKFIEGILNKYTGAHMTGADKEKLEAEDKIADVNADVAYMRQKEFQDLYLTPQAQLTSQARAYDSLGINRMLMAGGQAGASASTVPQSSGGSAGSSAGSGDILGVLTSLIGVGAKVRESNSVAEFNNARARRENILANWEDKQQEAIYNERLASIDNLKANLPKIIADAQHAEILAQYAPQLFNSQVIKNNKDADLAVAKAAEARSQVKLNDAEAAEVYQKIQNHKKEIELMNNEIMKIQQECITLGTQAYLNDQLVSESMSRVAKYEKQIELIGKQIGLTDKEITWYKYNHAHQNAASGNVSLGFGLISVGGSGQGHAYGNAPE